ncbi:hypothetical protein LYSHEL_14980 [Lysobacter helvus]|uniref:DUF3892 domain-containing protein n=2 Tax=Lysobacteraceae TaxID=32033 RepID=A0ABM7Q5D8_9GAMM|nr:MULTISPECIES: DUF3892 domain-containing protein [Lysobacter]BCT92474.1 hypothetical protein LYSCAS_14980 [Lysobacter caseinilyticus]BCT95627.1 hypothetical protein LYSHEL_14980 [Lysobacter helvus]
MPDTVKVTCINTREFGSADGRISHVGGWGWKFTQEETIDHIETGRLRCYINVLGEDVWIVVATRNGRKYLRTEIDDEDSNALLNLPECPA